MNSLRIFVSGVSLSLAAAAVPITSPVAVTVANSPAVQQGGPWSVNLDPGAQVLATIAFGSSVAISSLPPVPIAANQTIGIDPSSNGVKVLSIPRVELTAGNSVGIDSSANGVKVLSMPQVEVAGTPNVNVVSMPQVALAGTPSVNVASMPSVAVSSLPAVTIANQPGAGTRYAATITLSQNFADPVPSGKRLILTHVSSVVQVAPGHQAQMRFYLPYPVGNGLGAILAVPLTPDGVVFAGGPQFISSQQLDVILESGEQPYCVAYDTSGNNAGISGFCTFFGRLIDN